MELLIQFTVADHCPEVDEDMVSFAARLHLEAMLMAPYVLIETLALSARRLSTLRSEKAATYAGYAVALQTKAISLYNGVVSSERLDSTNCVPVIQFASLLGRHLLADLLARRDPSLDAFLDCYVECVRIHGGIKAIIHSAWPFLIDSDIKDFLLWAAEINSSVPVGRECDPLRALVAECGPAFDSATHEACDTVLRLLQVGYDQMAAKPARNRRYMMVFSWSVAAPPEFTELLVRRVPEALVVLAYFAVLLHYSRDLWQVGTSGAYIIKAIAHYLGPGYDRYMAYPLSVLAADPL